MSDGEDYKDYLRYESDCAAVQSSQRRNRRALALFVVLILLGSIAIFAYFATGRGWSVAATMMDDRVGNMKAYTAVVFNGVGNPPASDMEERALLRRQPVEPGSSDSASDEAGDFASTPNDSDASDLSHGLLPVDENGEISYNNLGDKVMSIFYRAMAKLQTEDQDRIYASDVRDLYETAGAEACTLNVSDPAYYKDPVVYDLGKKRVGLFSVSSYTSRSKIASISASLRSDGADVVICITPRTSMVSTFDGIDIVVSTTQSEQSDDADKGEALKIQAPYEGKVGIILISENNVSIYKSISEL